MITREEARCRVEQYLRASASDIPMILLDDHTRDEDFGWVFFYQSAKFVETGDMLDAVAGNAPLIVDRETGDLHVTGTARSSDFYVAEYAGRRGRAAVTANNPVLGALQDVHELDWVRASNTDEPVTGPPSMAWRFAAQDGAVETAIVEAVAAYRGRVSWVARMDEDLEAWVIAPLKYHLFCREHRDRADGAAEYFLQFPEVCREAVSDIRNLGEHLRARLVRR